MLESTRRVFQLIGETGRTITGADRFILVGGTALSLLEGHRQSEDLDFIAPGPKLPVRTVDAIIQSLRAQGAGVEQVVNIAAQQDFENDGLDIDDYQRDYAVDGVKVTFFAAGPAEAAILKDANPQAIDGVRVADIDTLFRLKAVLLTERVTARDLFDLHHFAARKGRGVASIFEAVRKYHPTYPIESVKHRLTRAPLRPDDPGFEGLCSTTLTAEEIRAWFQSSVDEWEIQEAARIAAEIESESIENRREPSPFD